MDKTPQMITNRHPSPVCVCVQYRVMIFARGHGKGRKYEPRGGKSQVLEQTSAGSEVKGNKISTRPTTGHSGGLLPLTHTNTKVTMTTPHNGLYAT